MVKEFVCRKMLVKAMVLVANVDTFADFVMLHVIRTKTLYVV